MTNLYELDLCRTIPVDTNSTSSLAPLTAATLSPDLNRSSSSSVPSSEELVEQMLMVMGVEDENSEQLADKLKTTNEGRKQIVKSLVENFATPYSISLAYVEYKAGSMTKSELSERVHEMHASLRDVLFAYLEKVYNEVKYSHKANFH